MTIGEQTDPKSFLHWALKETKAVSGHLTRSWHALDAIRKRYPNGEIQTAMEYFGGMGAHSLMVEEMFTPSHHWVNDFSAEAVAHLRANLPSSIDVNEGDAYKKATFRQSDLVVFDCGDLTIWKIRENELPRIALDRIFEARPKAVMITDIAAPYLHLQVQRYETILGEGTCKTYEGYLNALLDHFEREYGYVLLEGYWHRWSAVMSLVPKEVETRGQLLPTPESPVGLQLF